MFHDGGFMIGVHGLWWLLGIALLAVLIFLPMGFRARRDLPSDETPLEVLQRRLATGELTIEEYEQRVAHLHRDGASRGN